jgi:hypothetical protein
MVASTQDMQNMSDHRKGINCTWEATGRVVERHLNGVERYAEETLVGVRKPDQSNKIYPVAWKHDFLPDNWVPPEPEPELPEVVECAPGFQLTDVGGMLMCLPIVTPPPVPIIPPIASNSRFKIDLIIPNNATCQAYMASEYGTWIRDAVRFWEGVVLGLRYSSEAIRLKIGFEFKQLKGTLLGIAGPGNGDIFTGMTSVAGVEDAISACRLNSPYATVERATMHFSTDHYKINPENGTQSQRKEAFFWTAVHEMAHCLGFGLWNGDFRIVADMGFMGRWKLPSFPTALTPLFPHNNVTKGDPHNVRYTGKIALNNWRDTMVGRSNDEGIYIENIGMKSNTTMANAGGTAGAHWKQNYSDPLNTGVGPARYLTGVTDYHGNDMKNEMMTGWMGTNYDDQWMGRFSIGALADIGLAVDYAPLSVPIKNYKSV